MDDQSLNQTRPFNNIWNIYKKARAETAAISRSELRPEIVAAREKEISDRAVKTAIPFIEAFAKGEAARRKEERRGTKAALLRRATFDANDAQRDYYLTARWKLRFEAASTPGLLEHLQDVVDDGDSSHAKVLYALLEAEFNRRPDNQEYRRAFGSIAQGLPDWGGEERKAIEKNKNERAAIDLVFTAISQGRDLLPDARITLTRWNFDVSDA